MKKSILIILLIMIIQLTSLTACAQQKVSVVKANSGKEQSGNVMFVAPTNWQRLESDANGQVIFVAPNSNEGTVITILPGQQLYGSLKTWFEDFLIKSEKGKEKIAGGEIKQASSDEGYQVLFSQRVVTSGDGSVSYQFYVAAHPGNRVEVVALISTNANQFNQYQPIFQQFISNIDFANIKTGNTSNSRSDNKNKVSSNTNALNGLFVATVSRQQFNPNSKLYDYIVRQQYYLFGSEGRVYFGLPKGNIKDIDLACNQDPANCGEYYLSNNQLQLIRQGQPQSFNLEKSNNGFKLGNSRFYLVGSFDGLKLNGTYSFRSFANLSGGAGGVSGGVSGERTISFSSDGRFAANNFVGFAASGGVSGAASTTTRSGQGRYQINSNTLTLIYSSGSQEQFSFFVYPENEQEAKPGLIVIGTVAYFLRN